MQDSMLPESKISVGASELVGRTKEEEIRDLNNARTPKDFTQRAQKLKEKE